MKKYFFPAAAFFLAASPAMAKPVSAVGNGCATNENASVSISFSGYDKDVAAVKGKLDSKIDEIKALADAQHFDKFDVQSNSYNINANSRGDGEKEYQYSGNASFLILPSDKAVDFMVLLTKKGYQASVSVNNYRSGNCN